MDDKNLMENILMLAKGGAGLYHHGTVEASTPNVREAFKNAMNETLCMQADVYDKMAAKGWYPAQQADRSKIDSVRLKYSKQ